MVFGIIPECRSASSRIQRSASPESPPIESAKRPHPDGGCGGLRRDSESEQKQTQFRHAKSFRHSKDPGFSLRLSGIHSNMQRGIQFASLSEGDNIFDRLGERR